MTRHHFFGFSRARHCPTGVPCVNWPDRASKLVRIHRSTNQCNNSLEIVVLVIVIADKWERK